MTKMDRDGNNTVDFEEFYYWCACHLKNFCVCCGAALLAPCPLWRSFVRSRCRYEQEMEKKAVQLNLQLKMSEFEAEATARAETIQELESNLFEAQKRVDQVPSPVNMYCFCLCLCVSVSLCARARAAQILSGAGTAGR